MAENNWFCLNVLDVIFFSALDVKGSNLAAQNDFTFDQDKKHCDVFIFVHKDFERVQAK